MLYFRREKLGKHIWECLWGKCWNPENGGDFFFPPERIERREARGWEPYPYGPVCTEECAHFCIDPVWANQISNTATASRRASGESFYLLVQEDIAQRLSTSWGSRSSHTGARGPNVLEFSRNEDGSEKHPQDIVYSFTVGWDRWEGDSFPHHCNPSMCTSAGHWIQALHIPVDQSHP